MERGDDASTALQIGTPILGSEPLISETRSDAAFDKQYPTWKVWRFRRTLSYWVAVLYLEGSILFTVGALFSCFRSRDASGGLIGYSHPWGLVAVDGPYLAGGVCFTVGSYCGVLELINVGNDDGKMEWFFKGPSHWQRLKSHISWESLASYMTYLIGALFFNVMTITPYVPWLHDCCYFACVRMCGLIGGLCFTMGGGIEAYHGNILKFKMDIFWWCGFMNSVGGFLFLVSGVGYVIFVVDGPTWGEQLSFWVICVPYVVGSAMYWIGSFLALYLWKDEQFGLGKAPELNTGTRRKEASDTEEAMMAAYGCGKSDTWQLPWLQMYLINATASVLNVGFVLLYTQHTTPLKRFHDVTEAILSFLLSHGVMLLGSVLHHVPTVRPFNWLLIYMRLLLLFITANGWVSVAKALVEHSDCTFTGAGCPGHQHEALSGFNQTNHSYTVL